MGGEREEGQNHTKKKVLEPETILHKITEKALEKLIPGNYTVVHPLEIWSICLLQTISLHCSFFSTILYKKLLGKVQFFWLDYSYRWSKGVRASRRPHCVFQRQETMLFIIHAVPTLKTHHGFQSLIPLPMMLERQAECC